MNEVFDAIKKSAVEIKELIECGDTGKSESENSTGDTQLKLDIASDEIIERIFKDIKSIKAIVSEEQEHIVDLYDDGKYLIAYDPLDGSSLIDVNLSVGSIFGIYENSFEGKNIVASVYVAYGPRVEMVLASKNGVEFYRMIGNEFKFIKNLNLLERGDLNATGSTQMNWTPYHRNFVDSLFEDDYRLRYSGGMVPDLHQILLKGGGVFSYPGTTDKPKGKLRQLFEVFPFAFIYEEAGGAAIDGHQRVLDIETTHIHDTTPCFFGSKYEIEKVKEVYSQNEQ